MRSIPIRYATHTVPSYQNGAIFLFLSKKVICIHTWSHMFYTVTSISIAFYYSFISLLSFLFLFSLFHLLQYHTYLVMELLRGGELLERIRKKNVCRMGGQSADEESGVFGQLHAWGGSRTPRPKTRGRETDTEKKNYRYKRFFSRVASYTLAANQNTTTEGSRAVQLIAYDSHAHLVSRAVKLAEKLNSNFY